jgi:predicted lipoprotein with Yx(FWY)xxD motif
MPNDSAHLSVHRQTTCRFTTHKEVARSRNPLHRVLFVLSLSLTLLLLMACQPIMPVTPTPAAEAEAPAAAAPAATVMVATNDALGSFLVDAEGMTLYLFLNDQPGVSNCYDQCAENWPPLLVEGEPVAGEGADAALLGTTERTDGAMQVTYNGWPLYYFVRDAAPGDTVGQGRGDVWYVISPAGEQVD